LYVPRAVVHHAIGGTVRRKVSQQRVEYLKTRNRALFARRNLRGWTRWGALAYLIVTKPGRAIVELFSGRPALGWAFVAGVLEGLFTSADQPARRPSG
jgi:GT2 family glycosyltransferase